MERSIIQRLAELIHQRINCIASNNTAWLRTTEDRIEHIRRNLLPHGSGIDGKNIIDLEKSTRSKIIIYTSFHHMNDGGYYDGWTEHTITITPAFIGVSISVSGPNRNDIRDYLDEMFGLALSRPIDENKLPEHVV